MVKKAKDRRTKEPSGEGAEGQSFGSLDLGFFEFSL
jgi:hypothetical protein